MTYILLAALLCPAGWSCHPDPRQPSGLADPAYPRHARIECSAPYKPVESSVLATPGGRKQVAAFSGWIAPKLQPDGWIEVDNVVHCALS